jgi:hypothetical protein
MLLAPAAFAWSPAAPNTFKDIPGKPHIFILVANGPAEALTQGTIVQLRDDVTVWAAPTGWKLAARGQKGTYVVLVPVTSKASRNRARARAVIWANYAYIDNGQDSDLASDDDYPMDDEFVGYPFGYWDYSFWDFYDTAPCNYFVSSPRHGHRPSPICPAKGTHPTEIYVKASYRVPALAHAFRLPAPSGRVMAYVRSFSAGGNWGPRGYSSRPGFASHFGGGGRTPSAASHSGGNGGGGGGGSGGGGGGGRSSGGGGGGGGFSGGGGVSTFTSTTSK